MTVEATPEPSPEAPVAYGDLFRSVPDPDTAEEPQAAPDESEAGMGRLRTPFDV